MTRFISSTSNATGPRALAASLAAALAIIGAGCGLPGPMCTDIGCSSSVEVSYGALVIDEPYELSYAIDGQTTVVACLAPGEEPPPPEVSCDEQGFSVDAVAHDLASIEVSVQPLGGGTPLIDAVTVPIEVAEEIEINGPGCGPDCYRLAGNVDDGT